MRVLPRTFFLRTFSPRRASGLSSPCQSPPVNQRGGSIFRNTPESKCFHRILDLCMVDPASFAPYR